MEMEQGEETSREMGLTGRESYDGAADESKMWGGMIVKGYQK